MKKSTILLKGTLLISLFIHSALLLSATSISDDIYQQNSSLYSKGLKYEEKNNFQDAFKTFKKIASKNTNNTPELLYHIGYCQLYLTKADSAIITLNQALEQISDEHKNSDLSIDIHLTLGKSYQLTFMPNDAIEIYYTLLKIINESDADLRQEIEEEIQSCKNAQIFMDNPVSISVKNMGSNINSAANDHSPIVTTDESQIYYTSRQDSKTKKTLSDGSNPEKIYHSVFSSNIWSKSYLLEMFFKNFENESALSLSADGTELFLFRNDAEGQSLYQSIYDGKKWAAPFKLPKPINGPHNQTHACLSPDKSTLFFTSDRDGGFGGKDIYLVRRSGKNGTWGSLTNLGEKINTKQDEETPVFHFDGKTLYFASEGHNSMGRMDVFYSQMNSDSTWSEAINLGYPINSPDDDFFFAPSVNKEHAYYASARQGENYGGTDIYRVEFKKFLEGDLAVIEGNITPNKKEDLANGKVRILVSQKDPDKQVGNYYPNKDGKVTMFLETGKKYILTQKEEGFIDSTKTISLTNELAYKPGSKFVSFASLKVEPPLIALKEVSDTLSSANKALMGLSTPAYNTQVLDESVSSKTAVNTEEKTYTIQLLALKRRSKPFKNYFKDINGYKIKQHRCIDGYTRYTIGTFHSIPEATNELKILQKSGKYTDAFVRNTKHHGENHQH